MTHNQTKKIESMKEAGGARRRRARAAAESGRTAMNLYLAEIGETPRLTLAEEKELARRVQAGDEAARERMIKANLRLVVKIARDYSGRGIALLDLVAEGNIGLMKAVDRYDPERGVKFSTYAAWWIKNGMRRCLATSSSVVRVPENVANRVFKLGREEEILAGELGRRPSDAELAEHVGMTGDEVRKLRRAEIRATSFDDDSSEDGLVLRETMADDEALDPSEVAADHDLMDGLHALIGRLTDREREIVLGRFGFNLSGPQTFREIGDRLGFSSERIRQIHEGALAKLRDEAVGLTALPAAEPEPLAA